MKFSLKTKRPIDLLIHLSIMAGIALILIMLLFNVYLPSTTNHGESITVPDVVGFSTEDLDEFLLKRNLRYEISDSIYSNQYPPLTVLQQFPKPGAKVKENRKIYISINREEPPKISMPDLTIGSLKNAEAVLESFELKRGQIIYEPDLALNRVLEQHYQGKPVEPGTKLPKGSVIDLVVGDGLGKSNFIIDNFVGMPLDEAKTGIAGQNLRVGTIINENEASEENGIVMRQFPEAGEKVRIGQTVDLWITPRDSVSINEERQIFNESQERDESTGS